MMQQEQEETTPLQSVRDCFRRLKQEWEGMMQNVDVISSEVLSSLKAQEAALAVEHKEVQSLKLETQNLKNIFFQTTQEQDTKALAERKLANEIKVNIHNQLGEVKELQCCLANQLARMRGSIDKIKTLKQQGSADSSLLCSASRELCNSVSHQPEEQLEFQILLPLEDKDPGVPNFCSGSPTAYPGRLISDTHNKSFTLKDTEATAITSQKVFEHNVSRPKSEVLRSNGNRHSESKVRSTRPLLACRSGPDRVQLDRVSVKTEFDEEAERSLEDGSVQKLLYNAASSAPSVESVTDELDNVLLSERLKMLVQKYLEGRSTKEDDGGPPCVALLEKKKLLGLGRSSVTTKRKWEVPIEVALQEDAPGLLEKLQERGLLEGMTIYGAACEGDWENTDEHFRDLECVAKKVWGVPSGLIKIPKVIHQHASGLGKGPVYCLSCLVSLIDQAKSLRQRNWPVEWGWCRELQAFIFVFDKHNRVVLERPEYANATYFFELVQSLPVNWQVLRLIHVLSVTALGKTALLENRPLEVGYELTEGESKILEGFGWAAGTGLGSFLNFCDRVIHDVKDDDNLEWRQKIGKCLMDGYDRGRIMTPCLPVKFLKGSKTLEFETDIKPGTVLST
ncbi:hypothetical protein GOP47_0015419 [Adiantum capillus-veneris]|uniref:Uncharacterized protein n=1 Tax=Adiantum capillus-veneris TaxID=13818 RepID=A0A9D4UJL3_ADICA|nr:hypothetical protein GOP47_0015419 [Adiantum capillus-veneris]